MSQASTSASIAEELLLRARAYGLCALLLSDTTSDAEFPAAAKELMDVVAGMGIKEAAGGLVDFMSAEGLSPSGYLRPFQQNVVSPYETSYEPAPGSPGEKPLRLADIAGFYRAFGFQVAGERPDHIAAELEFVALLLAKEAYGLISGEPEGAEVCRRSRATFVKEHLSVWLPRLTGSVAETARGSPLEPILELASRLNRISYG